MGGNDKTLNCVITMLRSYLKQDTHNIFHTYEDLAGAITRLVEETEESRGDAAAATNTVSSVAASLVSTCVLGESQKNTNFINLLTFETVHKFSKVYITSSMNILQCKLAQTTHHTRIHCTCTLCTL